MCGLHRVVTFCYGCGLDTPGQVHVCEPKSGSTCWETLHNIRTGQRIGETLVRKQKPRKPPKSPKTNRRWKYNSSRKRKSRSPHKRAKRSRWGLKVLSRSLIISFGRYNDVFEIVDLCLFTASMYLSISLFMIN